MLLPRKATLFSRLLSREKCIFYSSASGNLFKNDIKSVQEESICKFSSQKLDTFPSPIDKFSKKFDQNSVNHKYKTLARYLINTKNRRFHLRVSLHNELKHVSLAISQYDIEKGESKILPIHDMGAVQKFKNIFDEMLKKMKEHQEMKLSEPDPIIKITRVEKIFQNVFAEKVGNMTFSYKLKLLTSFDGGYLVELILDTKKHFEQRTTNQKSKTTTKECIMKKYIEKVSFHILLCISSWSFFRRKMCIDYIPKIWDVKTFKIYFGGNHLEEFRDTFASILNTHNDEEASKKLLDYTSKHSRALLVNNAKKTLLGEKNFYYKVEKSKNIRIGVKFFKDNAEQYSCMILEKNLTSNIQKALWMHSINTVSELINSLNNICLKYNQIIDSDKFSILTPEETAYSEAFTESHLHFTVSLIYDTIKKDEENIDNFVVKIQTHSLNQLLKKVNHQEVIIPLKKLPEIRDYLEEMEEKKYRVGHPVVKEEIKIENTD